MIDSRLPKENMTVFMGSEGVLRVVPRCPEGAFLTEYDLDRFTFLIINIRDPGLSLLTDVTHNDLRFLEILQAGHRFDYPQG